MERKKRIETAKYNPPLRSRNDGFLGGAHTTEQIHWGRRWLDVYVDEFLQPSNVRTFRSAKSMIKTRRGMLISFTYSTISLTIFIRLPPSSLNLRSSPFTDPPLSVVAMLLV